MLTESFLQTAKSAACSTEDTNEKYYYLPGTLPVAAINPGTIHTGDLMLYGSNCLVLFYKTFTTSYNYTPLGTLDDTTGLESDIDSDSITVTFEIIENQE